MLRLFKDRRRLALLVLLAALAGSIPPLMSWLESRGATTGEPNASGGLSFHDRNPKGVRVYPAPLAAVIKPYPEARDTELQAETDATGELRSATILGSATDDLSRMIAFYTGPGRVPPAATAKRRYSVAIVDLGPMPDKRRSYRITVSPL